MPGGFAEDRKIEEFWSSVLFYVNVFVASLYTDTGNVVLMKLQMSTKCVLYLVPKSFGSFCVGARSTHVHLDMCCR